MKFFDTSTTLQDAKITTVFKQVFQKIPLSTVCHWLGKLIVPPQIHTIGGWTIFEFNLIIFLKM